MTILLWVALWICMAMFGATLIIKGFDSMTDEEYASHTFLTRKMQYGFTYILFLLLWPVLYVVLPIVIIMARVKSSM